jgi:hypothetical protein
VALIGKSRLRKAIVMRPMVLVIAEDVTKVKVAVIRA